MRGLLRNLGVGLYCDSSSYEAEETAVSSVAPPQTVSSSGCQQGEPIAQAWVTLSRLCNLENCGEESKPQAWGLSHIQTDACTWDNTEKFVQKDITHTSPQSDAQTHTYTHNTCICCQWGICGIDMKTLLYPPNLARDKTAQAYPAPWLMPVVGWAEKGRRQPCHRPQASPRQEGGEAWYYRVVGEGYVETTGPVVTAITCFPLALHVQPVMSTRPVFHMLV